MKMQFQNDPIFYSKEQKISHPVSLLRCICKIWLDRRNEKVRTHPQRSVQMEKCNSEHFLFWLIFQILVTLCATIVCIIFSSYSICMDFWTDQSRCISLLLPLFSSDENGSCFWMKSAKIKYCCFASEIQREKGRRELHMWTNRENQIQWCMNTTRIRKWNNACVCETLFWQ